MDFHQLAKDVCDRFLLEDPALLVSGHSIDVDGITAAFHWDPTDRPDFFTLVVDFGRPAASDERVYAGLLHRNYQLIANDAGMFSLDPASQHVLYARTFDIGRTTTAGVIDALMGAVEEARKWQAAMR